MKILYLAPLAILLILPACERRGDHVRASGERVNTDQLKAERDQYVRSIEAKLNEFDQKFDGLNARAASMSKPARDGFNNAVDSLRRQRKDVTAKLDDLKKVSLESWSTLRTEVDTAIADLERSYENVSAAHETVPATNPKSAPAH